MSWLGRLFKALFDRQYTTEVEYIPLPPLSVTPSPVPPAPAAVPASVLDWSTPKGAFHATRVTADNLGLSLAQKNLLCACIYQESAFKNDAVCFNKDRNGRVWSRDIGLVQINTYFHIGVGKEFPSEEYVLAHPDKCVAWMAGILKRTGKLQPWSSYQSGAYRQWLSPASPMWALKT